MQNLYRYNYVPPVKPYPGEDYKMFAGPKGRIVAARLRNYKRRVMRLYIAVGFLALVAGGLSAYICSILNGG